MLRRQDGALWSLEMKKLVIAFVMATFVASPAFSQKRHAISPEAAAAQAYAPSDPGALTVDPYTVVVNGQIVGRDPDPNVRLMLRRDPKADAS
jgi:uncharacterized protein (UPF0333 family)